ncbi:MAG: helix-turn-helix transcriptional regulator [Aeriscardovia sp.]|nr:helix-turn-helix transcriptional regulator [Aeriscardovia sp.]
MENLDDFGKRLRALREERDLSLDMVVYDIDQKYTIELTKGHLSRWENGKNLPSVRYAAYLAKYYNVSLDYLIGLTDVKTPTNLLARKKEDNK